MSKLIHLVGASGTGKSTIHRKLTGWLNTQGYNVQSLIEPDPLSELIKNYRLKRNKNILTEAAIFATDRLISYNKKVFPRINEENLIFLSARGVFDTIVYQGLLGGVNLDLIKKMNSSIPLPDLALILTVQGDIGYQRLTKRNNQTGEPFSRNETPEKINILNEYYKSLPNLFPKNNIKIIDTTNLNQEKVFQTCCDLIQSNLK